MTGINFPSRDMKQEAAWNEYLEALKRAHDTRDFRDGVAAGKAWSRFLNLFCSGRPAE